MKKKSSVIEEPLQMHRHWILYVFIAPLLDLASYIWRNDEFVACANSWCEFVALIQILISWSGIFILLAYFLNVTRQVKFRSIKLTLLMLNLSFMIFLTLWILFYWGFLIIVGYAPSGSVIGFLASNLAYIPNHLLQTAPLVMIFFILLLFLVTGLFYLAIAGVESKMHLMSQPKRFAVVVTTLFIVGGFGLVEPVPTSPAAYLLTSAIDNSNGIELDVERAVINYRPRTDQSTTIEKPAPNTPVIVIMVESLRHDLLKLEPSPVPFLRSLSEQSIVFDRSYATSSHSNYADLSVWYSSYPLYQLNMKEHSIDDWWRGESLFSVMKHYGYKTAYISSQNEKWGGMINWLDVPEVDYFYHSENYDGDTWFNEDDDDGIKSLMKKGLVTAGKIEDSATLAVAKRWIDSQESGTPFVLGLNLQNTHFSYVLPDDGARPFQPDELGFRAVYYRWPKDKAEQVKNRYLNAVYNVDSLLRDFVEFLKKRQLWDQSIFVVIGDSGEAFYEHGFGNHSGPMYEEVMKTITLFKPPSSTISKVISHPISHIDILPAILDTLRLPEEESFQGVSPFSLIPRKRVFMHTNAIVQQHGIIDGPWKLLHNYQTIKKWELYNLDDDAGETVNLITQYPTVAKELRFELDNWINNQLVYYNDPKYFNDYFPPRSLTAIGSEARVVSPR